MKKKEIVVLDCGVEVRQEDPGIIFMATEPGREFAFCIKANEIPDMITYLDNYWRSRTYKAEDKFQPELPGMPKPSVAEKVASLGVTGEVLADPRSVKPGAGRVITTGVAVHKS